MQSHDTYMRRALQLAANGFTEAFPNPMVGAVIAAPDGRIIGEGYHRRCGEPHAEVNAVASVQNPDDLLTATMYVTLEPCAHYGRTPPCAKLIIDKRIPRVVVGCRDPFDKVDGKGIDMLRNAGVEVTLGVLQEQCRALNAVFFTAHTLKRPFVMLKWAQSADGFMDRVRREGSPAARISNAETSILTHRLRSMCDGILCGSGTVIADNPSLTTRLWPGKSPRPVIIDARGRIPADAAVMSRDPLVIDKEMPLGQMLGLLYDNKITSLMVEGGPDTLQRFIDAGLWDIARVETSPQRFGASGCVKAPETGTRIPDFQTGVGGNMLKYYVNNNLIDVKNCKNRFCL